jgi:hypothetical protein
VAGATPLLSIQGEHDPSEYRNPRSWTPLETIFSIRPTNDVLGVPHDGGRAERTRGERTARGSGEGEPKKERTPRLDWAGLLRSSFALDVFAYPKCGDSKWVLPYQTVPSSPARLPSHDPALLPGYKPLAERLH